MYGRDPHLPSVLEMDSPQLAAGLNTYKRELMSGLTEVDLAHHNIREPIRTIMTRELVTLGSVLGSEVNLYTCPKRRQPKPTSLLDPSTGHSVLEAGVVVQKISTPQESSFRVALN
jgi:hypothetical protein